MMELELMARMVAALLFGAAIGMERQWRHRMAGMRTNALVATGAALFVILPILVEGDASPTRVAAQVVSGIGFLGAGVILREGINIRGLNTAATLWCSAAVGVLAGSGFVGIALIGASVVIGANVLLRPIARRLDRQPAAEIEVETETAYRFRVVCKEDNELHVRTLLLHALNGGTAMLRGLHSQDLEGVNRVEVCADLVTRGSDVSLLEQVVARLSLEAGVTAVSWDVADVSEAYG